MTNRLISKQLFRAEKKLSEERAKNTKYLLLIRKLTNKINSLLDLIEKKEEEQIREKNGEHERNNRHKTGA